ncbi:hypothetical protein ACVFYP_09140 [Roseomonas sp. F4]
MQSLSRPMPHGRTGDATGRMLRWLGLVPEAGAAELAARMGQDVALLDCGAPALVALVQPAEAPLRRLFRRRDSPALLRAWPKMRQRLERAAAQGAFLACDPVAALCPEDALRRLLHERASALATALARQGLRQQWDVVLHGDMAPAAAQTALEAALHPHILAMAGQAHCAGEGVACATVILRSGDRPALVAALEALPLAPRCEWRGPLPALALGAPRLVHLATGWAIEGLPERRESNELTQLWQGLASALQPGAPVLLKPARLATTDAEAA